MFEIVTLSKMTYDDGQTAKSFYVFTAKDSKFLNLFSFYTVSHLIFVTFLPGNIFNTPNIEIFSPGQKLRYFKSFPP